jgi:NAD-dependent DNA ligase
MRLDANGQPPRRLYRARVNDRLVAELLGVVRGAICDGIVTATEARALAQWVDSHPEVVQGFPGDLIAERLARIFADGHVNDDEREDLLTLLRDLVGEPAQHTGHLNHATRLPLDDPPPSLVFAGHEYCLTGKFAYGTRKGCEQAVIERGGTVHSDVRARTNVLVIGTFGSDAWVQSSWGRKILAAMDARNAGRAIRIVAEEHWVAHLR